MQAVSPVEVARRYGRAKSCQNIEEALACCTDDFSIETVPFATFARGRAEVAEDLRVFFELFPDYEFVGAGAAESDGTVVLWGYARMTWTGRLPRSFGWVSRLRLPARRVELPAVAVLGIRDGKLCHERFFFDMPDFCRQLGLPRPIVSGLLRRLERKRHAALEGAEATRVEHSAIYDAPIEEVYERAFADVTELMRASPPRWFIHAKKIELNGAPVMQTGAVRTVHVSNGHVTHERIEACVPPRLIRYRVENGWGFPLDAFAGSTHGSHELEPLEGGRTRVTWRGWGSARSRLTAPVSRLLVAGIVGPMQRRFLRSIAGLFDPAVSAPGGG